jgi:hypothetical protein
MDGEALHGAEATREIAVAIGGELELERVLELIVKRGRALVAARSLVILLRDGADLMVDVQATGSGGGLTGGRLVAAGSIASPR